MNSSPSEENEKPTQASRQRYTGKTNRSSPPKQKESYLTHPNSHKTPPAYPFHNQQCQTAETQIPRSTTETQKPSTRIKREIPKMAPGTASSKWEPKFLYYRQRAFLARLAKPDFAEIRAAVWRRCSGGGIGGSGRCVQREKEIIFHNPPTRPRPAMRERI